MGLQWVSLGLALVAETRQKPSRLDASQRTTPARPLWVDCVEEVRDWTRDLLIQANAAAGERSRPLFRRGLGSAPGPAWRVS
jgi:hypothetical protein